MVKRWALLNSMFFLILISMLGAWLVVRHPASWNIRVTSPQDEKTIIDKPSENLEEVFKKDYYEELFGIGFVAMFLSTFLYIRRISGKLTPVPRLKRRLLMTLAFVVIWIGTIRSICSIAGGFFTIIGFTNFKFPLELISIFLGSYVAIRTVDHYFHEFRGNSI